MSIANNPITIISGETQMSNDAYVGPVLLGNGSQNQAPRIDTTNARVVTDAHGRYHEAAARGNVFSATNAATNQALTTLLATTYVGLCISNPVGSGKVLSVLTFQAVSDGTVTGAVGSLGYGGGGSSAGVVTHTTPLAALWGPNLCGTPAVGAASAGTGSGGSIAYVDSACTLVGNPHEIGYAYSAITAAGNGAGANIDLAGQVVVAPGGYVMGVANIASMTHLLYAFTWEEVPLVAGGVGV